MTPPAAGTGAVRFNAANDYYSTTTNLPAAGSTFTVTCWVRVDSGRSFETAFSLDASDGYALALTAATAGSADWYLWDEAYDTISGPSRAVGTWYKAAVVVNGATWSLGMATAAGTLSLTSANRGLLVAPTRLRIGNNYFAADEWLDGRVAAFKMWNAALTLAEINAELAQYAPVRTSGLARYYPFITAPGITDEGPNGWNLTAGSTAAGTTDGPGIDLGGAPAGPVDVAVGHARAAVRATSPLLTHGPALTVRAARAATTASHPLLTAPTPVLPPERFYLGSGTGDITPTVRGSWTSVASSAVRTLGARSGSATNVLLSDTATTNPNKVLGMRFVSPPRAAQTLTGTLAWCIGAGFANAAADTFARVHMWVTVGDTSTVRGVLVNEAIGATEWTGNPAGREEPGTPMTPVNVQAGDRIVIEIGAIHYNSSATTYNSRLYYGGTGTTELTQGSTDVNNQPSWIEIVPAAQAAALTVTGARAAVRATRPLLTQQHPPLDVAAARVNASTSSPLLAQTHDLTAGDVRVHTRADNPTLTQVTPEVDLLVGGARGGTRATAPLVAQQHEDLVVARARATTTASVPMLAQHHPLPVKAARAATTASTPLLVQVSALQVDDARADTSAATTLLIQAHDLTVGVVAAETRASRPQLATLGNLAVHETVAAAAATRPLLEQQHGDLVVDGPRSDTRAGGPLLAQLHQLAVDDARSTPAAGSPLLDLVDALLIDEARAVTAASPPLLGQAHDLNVHAGRALPFVSSPALFGPVGEWVRNPTYVSVVERRGDVMVDQRGLVTTTTRPGSVEVQERPGDVLLDVPGPVLVEVPQGGVTVAADRRGLLVVDDRSGIVLDMT